MALTYYATHPQSYYRTGLANPDFPGIARDRRQAEAGIPHIHFDGAGGNIGAGKYNDGSPENRQVLADRVALAMKKALKSAEKVPLRPGDFGWRSEAIALPPAPPPRRETPRRHAGKPVGEGHRAGQGGQRPRLAPPLPLGRQGRRLLPPARPRPPAPPAGRTLRRIPARRPGRPPRPVRRPRGLRRLRPRIHRHRDRLLPGRLRDRTSLVARCPSGREGPDRRHPSPAPRLNRQTFYRQDAEIAERTRRKDRSKSSPFFSSSSLCELGVLAVKIPNITPHPRFPSWP